MRFSSVAPLGGKQLGRGALSRTETHSGSAPSQRQAPLRLFSLDHGILCIPGRQRQCAISSAEIRHFCLSACTSLACRSMITSSSASGSRWMISDEMAEWGGSCCAEERPRAPCSACRCHLACGGSRRHGIIRFLIFDDLSMKLCVRPVVEIHGDSWKFVEILEHPMPPSVPSTERCSMKNHHGHLQ